MIVVSKPFGGLLNVPDFGLSDDLSTKKERGRKQFKDQEQKDTRSTCKMLYVVWLLSHSE